MPFSPGRRVRFADLILFDIDGTLVRKAGPHHRMALEEGIRQVTGIATTTQGIPVHGMLDPDILTQMLQRVGYSDDDIRRMMPEIIEAAEEVYLATVPEIRDKCCPGAGDLLDSLRAQSIPLALVTGNVTRIGWKKLEMAGLHHYFEFGAFAEMAETRGGLARLAVEQARRSGFIGNGARIALVGDAPQDIRAAQENGIVSIAVKTGVSLPEELEELEPDHLIEDLTHWPKSL